MARCPDCNKFVSYDDSQDPEPNVDVDPEGRISGDVRVFLACSECGTELKEGSFDIEKDLSNEFEEHVKKGGVCRATLLNKRTEKEFEYEFVVDDLSQRDEILKAKLSEQADPIEVVEIEDPEHELEAEAESEITVQRKKGKNYYGHHTTVTVTCSCKKFEAVEEFDDEMSSGEMDELN